MSKIKYNKELSGKQLGRGGPRDLQERQKLISEESLRKEFLDEKKPEVDMSQYLHLDEVRKKIQEAVESTQASERKRYDSVAEILNAEKDKLNKIEQLLKENEKERVEKTIEVTKLQTKLESVEDISNQSKVLQEKLDRLYNKIIDGSIQPLVGKQIGRPELEDKIFINPLEEDKESQLDSYIVVKEEKTEDFKKDIPTDLEKLRGLLKSKGD